MNLIKCAAAIGRLKSFSLNINSVGLQETTMDFSWYLPSERGREVIYKEMRGNGEFYLFTGEQLRELLLPQQLDKILREE